MLVALGDRWRGWGGFAVQEPVEGGFDVFFVGLAHDSGDDFSLFVDDHGAGEDVAEADVFEHVELYVVGGQGVLMASRQLLLVRPSVFRRVEQLPSMQAHLALLRQQHASGIAELPRWRLYDEQAVDTLHARLPEHVRNTDMNRYLEYATPRYQVAPGRSTVPA